MFSRKSQWLLVTAVCALEQGLPLEMSLLLALEISFCGEFFNKINERNILPYFANS
jgi:hypothetical protein